jgi:hypothetical protein
MTDHLNRSIQIHDWSLKPYYTNTWVITGTVVCKYMTDHLNCRISHVFGYYSSSDQSCICILRFKWSVMYLYTTVQMIGHVFAYYSSSDQSCICILRFKWSVMYLYTTVQVISHVFGYYGSSERSCICILRFKWSVMYLYTTVQVIRHVWSHERSIQIHDWSLEP